MNAPWTRVTVDLSGVVQGVGFRPTLKRLADEAGLGGWVQNRSGTVALELNGPGGRVRDFLTALPLRLPANARLESMIVRDETRVPVELKPLFTIRSSECDEPSNPCIPADLAICPDCRREIFDPSNRRYGYPFTTCTVCGPRYTVIDAVPYDRARTTMDRFPLCPECRKEYENSGDRRYHAESIACPVCGPRLRLLSPEGKPIEGDPLRLARRAIAEGRIVAMRGIGGYLLACDAKNESAITELRRRKMRPHKPLAVMGRTLALIRRTVALTDRTGALMTGAVAPIIILPIRDTDALPFDLLTPDADTLGVMLPYSPLHELLMNPLKGDPTPAFDWLVMTSGNRRSEPICIGNDEALGRLSDVADLLLTHDREINLRNDDSLFAADGEGVHVWRRSRGLAPEAIRLRRPLRRRVLAMGAELKNTVAVDHGDRVVLSPHIGDLETPEAVDAMATAVDLLPRFLQQEIDVVAVDHHPDMHSTRAGVARALAVGADVVSVQHHHAHAVSALAENGFDTGMALVFDGTGLGEDGSIWGAELLWVEPGGFRRLATFVPVPLPGGDAAVARPARQLFARWVHAGVEITPSLLARLGADEVEADVWRRQIEARVNAPFTHAAGRLFDAASCALGLAPERITYEGQAAVRLETAARRHPVSEPAGDWPFDPWIEDDLLRIDWTASLRRVARAVVSPADAPAWAWGFHNAVASAALEMARYGRGQTGERAVALSGGVFMNGLLSSLVREKLSRDGFLVLEHHRVPSNDGGIAFGQAVVAGL